MYRCTDVPDVTAQQACLSSIRCCPRLSSRLAALLSFPAGQSVCGKPTCGLPAPASVDQSSLPLGRQTPDIQSIASCQDVPTPKRVRRSRAISTLVGKCRTDPEMVVVPLLQPRHHAFSCIPPFRPVTGRCPEIFAAPSHSEPVQWIRSVMINALFIYLHPGKATITALASYSHRRCLPPLERRRWTMQSARV
ncbi:hypothetical protein AOQ84DRAFT_37893 [Glonium stellatum]|uniref:Uncharacterized protein n=1 Tax=Glonium stellatum TaxID=574774 RepID=A0A8E2F286_9PEZI|nr:hypothetical protein AOQ84DRAFT_37893 [Glonium stellatum]